jgi:lipoprotein NlpD
MIDRMTTKLRSGNRMTRAFLIGIAVAMLGACSSTVVREPSASSPSRQTSQGKPGTTVRVQRGDTLYGIAFRNGVDVNDLARWNSLAAPYTIYPGQSLKLFAGSGGSRPPAATTTPTRPATTGTTTRPVPPPTTVTRPTTPAPANSGFSWRWPADGHLIGRFVAGDATKQGIDIAGSGGQSVRAAADGVVVYSGAGLVGYGELIIVKHSEAWLSAYGHNRKRLVNEGQSIKAGQQIAEMGSSGASREMLHFEIRHNGKPVDPLQYLPAR